MPTSRILLASTLLVLANVGCAQAERGETGEIETAGLVDAFTIQVGDCFNDRSTSADQVSDVPGVPCSEPHDNQVYGTFDLTMKKFPGEDRVNELADEGCLDRFEPAIGATFEESVLMITTLTPSRGSWTQAGDREVICVAYHMELNKLTGSVLGTGM